MLDNTCTNTVQDGQSGGDVVAENSPIKQIEGHLRKVHKELKKFGVERR